MSTAIAPVHYQCCIEAHKQGNVRDAKTTASIVKQWITELETAVIHCQVLPKDFVHLSLHRLSTVMSGAHSTKLEFLLFNQPTSNMDIFELSIFTHEGEVKIPLLIQFKREYTIYLLSEGGNVSTLTRLTYKLIRLLFNLKHLPFVDVCRQIERKRSKKEYDHHD